ncbi:MAG: starch phosphorylase [Candidatus Peregrinibacteria bacterium Gr01-1014_25]|nr:MAG: starch phosphorylase [Candidatus Peregrinibacteria bacterium Gr01-1014_25]
MPPPLSVAYFTMEIGLRSEMPTFAGGLGILAADILQSCADRGVAAVGMTVRWRHGYLRQRLKPDGSQEYENVSWNPEHFLRRLPQTVTVDIDRHPVRIGVWLLELRGEGGHVVPVYFLDTDLPENAPQDRDITARLYGGDQAMRIRQELALGIGGVRMLRALGYGDVGTFHMNEGHAAFLTLELLRERGFADDAVRPSCAFTTHTPVRAGHDVFPYDLAWRVAGDNLPWHIRTLAGDDALSMTRLAMSLGRYTCGVSQIHGAVSRRMFPGSHIDAITNGVHHVRWASPEMRELFDASLPGWRSHPALLGQALRHLPDEPLWRAHDLAKRRLCAYVMDHAGMRLDPDVLLIASARRVVPYKRPELLYTNLERFRDVCRHSGKSPRVQILHAGNAHPDDPFSQEVIKRMVQRSHELKDCARIVYLDNYNPDLAQLLVAGADVWLNTPIRLMEASGTSGMKASLNGTVNCSTLDGWWAEGYARDSEAGWRIGPMALYMNPDEDRAVDAEDLYTQLQFEVIPQYENPDRTKWTERMKRAIALIGHFNTDRCVSEYQEKAWGG